MSYIIDLLEGEKRYKVGNIARLLRLINEENINIETKRVEIKEEEEKLKEIEVVIEKLKRGK